MRRHALDVVSLVAGLVFIAIAIVGLSDWSWNFSLDARWILPVVLIGVGLIGLSAVLSRSRDHH
jgi:hypothetical protein